MCRLLGWCGPTVPPSRLLLDPARSLRRQSIASREAPVVRHGDGCGLAWYGRRGAPQRYRSASSAWNDDRWSAIATRVSSPLFIAHVRAATDGGADALNSHPFVHGRIAFSHVGRIGGIETIRDRLRASLPAPLQVAIEGDTDSELVFLLLLAAGLADDPSRAYRIVLERIGDAQRDAGTERILRMATVHADGRSLLAFRHATDGSPPVLHRSTGTGRRGVTVCSEPVTGSHAGWRAIPKDVCWRLSGQGRHA